VLIQINLSLRQHRVQLPYLRFHVHHGKQHLSLQDSQQGLLLLRNHVMHDISLPDFSPEVWDFFILNLPIRKAAE